MLAAISAVDLFALKFERPLITSEGVTVVKEEVKFVISLIDAPGNPIRCGYVWEVSERALSRRESSRSRVLSSSRESPDQDTTN